jgi:hypothetical protein
LTSEEEPKPHILRAIELNSSRRAKRFAEFKNSGASWMLECRDLWDSEDDDAGVYFVNCRTGYEVDDFIKNLDGLSDKILGLYDLSKPLADQGPGITLEDWKTR